VGLRTGLDAVAKRKIPFIAPVGNRNGVKRKPVSNRKTWGLFNFFASTN